jgi:hypothetical protein
MTFEAPRDEPEFTWDVPTAVEWLAIAGCESQPYPWGFDQPTPDHANLHLGSLTTTLQPVGLYPKGRSKWGADDCFQNPAVDCNTFRSFRTAPKKQEPRRNVSLRLIRIRSECQRSREEALARYMSKARSSCPDSIDEEGR